jgi:N-acyl-D-amino-acid deacylase
MQTEYDVIIRNGTIYDGSGSVPFKGDIAINGQKIVEISPSIKTPAKQVVDASGMAVAPGFINVMSWAPIAMLVDGKSQSDLRQGVTLEVFGEAWSEGPLNEKMKKEGIEHLGDLKYDITWTTLGQFLDHLASHGISNNIASYVGATTLRIYAIGYDDRPPTPKELDLMRQLTAQAMEEGALGVSSALIYPPGSYAKTEELVELAKVASKYKGIYISHIRSEGNAFLEAIDELLTIAREANIRTEIYHLKAMGSMNWDKMDAVIEKVEASRTAGMPITADMYTYTAGAAGIAATMPPWVQEGGQEAFLKRLRDPEIRARLHVEMTTPTDQWENMLQMVGKPENIKLLGFNTAALKPLTGKTLAEVCTMRGTDPVDTIIDLILEDSSNVGAAFFHISEDNIRKQLRLPWVCLGSDSESSAPEGDFLKSSTHPRGYGTFARFLGKYVRDEKVVSLQEAVRKITSLPASTLQLNGRGSLKVGYYADVAIFDPAAIKDNATFENPFQYATGVAHVFVNGVQVLKDGEHTGAKPGQVVRGPGYKG